MAATDVGTIFLVTFALIVAGSRCSGLALPVGDRVLVVVANTVVGVVGMVGADVVLVAAVTRASRTRTKASRRSNQSRRGGLGAALGWRRRPRSTPRADAPSARLALAAKRS
jgi:hypothetical protein